MTENFPIVGPEALPQIEALCARSISPVFQLDELRRTLFATDQPAIVRFAPEIGVIATVREGDNGFVRLLAVDPSNRGRGYGSSLLDHAEADLEGATVITVGADPPYFLYPGVPTSDSILCYMLERRHYSREEANYNVDVDLGDIPDTPSEGERPKPDERSVVEAWAAQHWEIWLPEFLRAFDQETLLITRDPLGISAACAYDVNRARTLGPIASRPDLMGKGAAKALLIGVLRQMRKKGYERIEVLWVGPLVPYVRVGGKVGSVFFVYRRRIWKPPKAR
jgi:GNAT superfamily N-acetyltransferase